MNIFKQAKQLLDKKDSGVQLTEEELQLINTAIIPLMVHTNGLFPKDMTIGEGLKELAKMTDIGRTDKNEETSKLKSHRQQMLEDRQRRVENKKRLDKLPWTQAEESVRTQVRRGG